MVAFPLARHGGVVLPSARDVLNIVIGGLAGFGLWEIWATVPTPLIAGGPLEPPSLIKTLFQARLGLEVSDVVAHGLHALTGILFYPLAYFLITRNLVSAGRAIDGWIWGACTWFIALGIFAPAAGLPFLLLEWGGQLSFASLVGHTLYGWFAAWVFEDRNARMS